MTIYEYDEHYERPSATPDGARNALANAGDEITQERAWHEEEMAEYALGRSAEGQERITRSMG